MIQGGLKLKREVAAPAPVQPIGELVVAHLWVDASVYHLDGEFSYLIPGNLAPIISVGSFVSVPFHGREISAVVVRITERGSSAGLKSISKVVGTMPLLSEAVLALIPVLCARYACHPFDLIRSAVPDRVAAIEGKFIRDGQLRDSVIHDSPTRGYLQLPPAQPRADLMARKVSALLKSGPTIVILPDLRELINLREALVKISSDFVEIGSHLPKSENYHNYLKARFGQTDLVIGMRSAVFTPLHNLAHILIYNEGSEHHYERRTPGWNVRDIALIRSQMEKVSLIFAGYSPSVEIARLIEEKWVSYSRSRAKVLTQTYPSQNGELLPSRALPPIKRALASGPVLFLVPLKGYAQAIRCQKCRTISRCQCGGAHEQLGVASPISCNHCGTSVAKWSCIWCHHEVAALNSRGIERHNLEIGKLFPGVTTQISSADHPIEHIQSSGIVIATPGCAPQSATGYSAVVVLEGNRFLNQPDMRSSERIREMYFSHAALIRDSGSVILIQDEGDQISTALSTWNPTLLLGRELDERRELSLPPYVRSAHLTLDSAEVIRFKNALSTALQDGKLPASTRILGPVPSGDKSALILTVAVGEGDQLLSTLHEFMRRRSAAKKMLPALRIDPYSLSR